MRISDWSSDVCSSDLLFAAPAVFDDLPRIRSGHSLVDDDRRRGAELRCDLVLVRPATVIGHRIALEHRRIELGRIVWIRDRRIVDQHDDGLAFQVYALVIVPAVFGCLHRSEYSRVGEEGVSTFRYRWWPHHTN